MNQSFSNYSITDLILNVWWRPAPQTGAGTPPSSPPQILISLIISKYLRNSGTAPQLSLSPVWPNLAELSSIVLDTNQIFSAGEITNTTPGQIYWLIGKSVIWRKAPQEDHSPHYYWRRLTMKGIFHVRYIIVHGLIWKPRKSEQKVVPGGSLARQYEVSTTCPF